MYLKALEVENFKSFKGEAVIPFDRGFTAITGPNGSGKSNCGDAVQFVLGARSAKVLRAQNSKDLIFNGGKSNRPARNAKVTLVFANPQLKNGRRRLPVDTDEVRMTREVRLTKGGNIVSSYHLNGEESGQKAFHRILGKANARPDGYNIVLQGDVTRLSQMTAMERRRVLDSVAGVTSYDEEIRKADRQRNQVEEYIDRISLVEDEQKARLKTLEKEKAAAERAKDAKEEFDNANIILHQAKHQSAKAELKHHADERTRYLSEAAELEASVKESEKVLLALDDKVGELETRIAEAMGGDSGGLLEQIRELQVSIAVNGDKIEEAKDLQNDDQLLLDELEQEITKAKEDLQEHEISLVDAKKALEESKEALKQCEAVEKEIQDSLENSGAANAALSRAASKANEKLEQCREAVNTAKVEAEKIANQAEMIAEQLSAAEEEVDDAQLSYDDLELQGEELGNINPDSDRTALANELRAAQKAEEKLIDESAIVQKRLQEAERSLVSSRMEMEKRSGNNGMAPGAAAVMAARDRGELSGIIGTISELCAPIDQSHGDALATAVGGAMSSIVVETDQVAAEAMALLKSKNAGRATFLPLNKMQTNRSSGKAAMVARKPGVIGFAHELLNYDPRIEVAVAYALRNTLVVDNLSTARRLMGGVRLVTLGGEITEPGGAMVGGSKARMKVGFGGKIQGASAVEKLVAEVDRLSLMAETVSAALQEARTKQNEIRGKINSIAEDDNSVKSMQWKAELEVASKTLTKAKGSTAQFEKRLSDLESEHKGKVVLLEDAKKELVEAESLRDNAILELQEASPEGIRTRLLEAQTLRLNAESESTRSQLVINSGADKTGLLSERLESQTTRADNIQATMAGREKSVKEWKESIGNESIELKIKEDERAVLLDAHQDLENERTELVDERAELRAAAAQRATSAINSRSMAEEITRSLAIKEQALADLLVEMAEAEIPVADDLIELPTVGDAERKTRDLQRKLDKFGPVNMLAIEQYAACKERLDEMKSDFKILQQRRKKLVDITDKLEGQRKSRLVATLKDVNANFEIVYKRLSGGGRGELFLENPDEPFKGGLDMWAQPYGKSNKSRLQGLSGGEKSMASLALIFAIQDYDPSPFYYFDEVDQNLDVSNSKLIANECRNRSQAAQFIMVTLRKVSLELADHHIGITHGGDGCSRRIVDFDRERAIALGEKAEKQARKAQEKVSSRIEEARISDENMPEVPEPLEAPKSLGGLLQHLDEEHEESSDESSFSAIADRAEDLSEEIAERQAIVSELLEESEQVDVEAEKEA
ncbi:MAG: chromosome segregation protein SMC [Candidatus Poseidoniaceae archaeon]|jgi:chromosome segregation protein|nr:chromosome segregation protein SMC [Candidatus Poseidoniaceae archaeon]